MGVVPRLRSTLPLLGWLALSAPDARADADTLHEGEALAAGGRTDGAALARAKLDLAIVPYPGGREMWGGPINATRVEATLLRRDDATFDAEEARVALIRWPHFHALAVERDVRLGTTVGAEAFGLYVPYVLRGVTGSDSWAIALLGGSAGYRYLRRADRARVDGHAASVTLRAHVDDQAPLGSGRLSVRGAFDAAYTVAFGALDGEAGRGLVQALVLCARGGLLLDVSRTPATRDVPRTDPVTGAVTHLRQVNEGARWRVALLELSLELRGFDTLSTSTSLAAAEVGVVHDF